MRREILFVVEGIAKQEIYILIRFRQLLMMFEWVVY